MGQFWLEFDNQGSRQRFDFNQMSVSIGRDPASDFHLDHPTVSRQHAMIVEGQSSHQLIVLSKNGLTAVNGQKVDGTIDLRAGQLIQLGELQFVFHANDGFTAYEPATEQVDLAALHGESTAPSMASGIAHAPTAALQSVGPGGQQLPAVGSNGNGGWSDNPLPPNPGNGFGGPSQSGFGSQPPAQQSGFGSQPPSQQSGFGSPRQSGFGSQPPAQQSGFGSPMQSGFGSQPPAQQSGFGGPTQSGFGSQPPTHQPGFGGPTQSGFGAPPAQEGGNPPPNGGAQDGEASEDFKIPSWDTIAAQAIEDDPQAPGQTDFQRLQKAQKKATAASKGTHPAVLALGGAGIVVAIYFLMFHEPPKPTVDEPPPVECQRRICPKTPISCPGKEVCVSQALNSYKVADKLYKEKDANITNLYEAYRQLDQADIYLGVAGLSEAPAEMKDYAERMAMYEKELDEIAKSHKQKLHMYKQRKMYNEMVDTIDSWKAHVGRESTWWQAAEEEERVMKDLGTYPRKRLKNK